VLYDELMILQINSVVDLLIWNPVRLLDRRMMRAAVTMLMTMMMVMIMMGMMQNLIKV